ncbi:hypothetical protein MPLA_70048 [Mesorhizobium sp. ORS 3359]|nr:hypothetical protein MPLA_70048 [Mesorhizobium sp. ORS 3359]
MKRVTGGEWRPCGRGLLREVSSYRLQRDRLWRCISVPCVVLRREYPWLTSTQAFPKRAISKSGNRFLRPIAPCAERRPACSAVAGGVYPPLPKTIVTRVRREGKKNRIFAGLGLSGREGERLAAGDTQPELPRRQHPKAVAMASPQEETAPREAERGPLSDQRVRGSER